MDLDQIYENNDIANIHCYDGLLQIPIYKIDENEIKSYGASLKSRKMKHSESDFSIKSVCIHEGYKILRRINFTDYYFYDYSKETFIKNFYYA